ncbi:hypothetical protein KVR01_005240 [Diaporthe batatas]|uniref:uncharacterized protein n=1 Tax=Diaporthe batatas TaxID=748121 RepID=UPI001D03C36B|nr:uncharacterized protein KVR01_005240 [Diaporthe batatas]KAG8164965.1 hypothetical protein KVR01_005240 [Diaporthe batatas]
MHTNAGAKQALARLGSLAAYTRLAASTCGLLRAPASTIAGALTQLDWLFLKLPSRPIHGRHSTTARLAIQDVHRSSRPSVTASVASPTPRGRRPVGSCVKTSLFPPSRDPRDRLS